MSVQSAVKRTRSANFSKSEESVLLALVDKYRHIIECKRTDGIFNKQKERAWEVLTDEFNAISGENPRETNNLKAKFDNLKRSAKKQGFLERRGFKVGGEGPNILENDSHMDKMRFILGVGCERLGLPNPYDSDADAIHSKTVYRPSEDISADVSGEKMEDSDVKLEESDEELEEPPTVYTAESHQIPLPVSRVHNVAADPMSKMSETDWSTWSSQYMLRMPVSTVLNIDKSQQTDDNDDTSQNQPADPDLQLRTSQAEVTTAIASMAQAKLQFYHLKAKLLKKEARAKCKRETELHKLQVELMTIEIKLKKQMLRMKQRSKNKTYFKPTFQVTDSRPTDDDDPTNTLATLPL